MLEKQYSEESEDAAHRSGSTTRLFFFQVFRLRLTYQQDVMGWSYVPAYLDSLCFLEWRVSWPAQTEQKHEDMALLTTFQLNFYTLLWEHLLLWLSFEFMAKTLWKEVSCSLRKQSTFVGATTGFPAKWRLRNERRNSILMTRHYPDLGSASDWLNQISHTNQKHYPDLMTRHQYGISALVSHTSFGGETSSSADKCRLFSQARLADVTTENQMLKSSIVYIPLLDFPSLLHQVKQHHLRK